MDNQLISRSRFGRAQVGVLLVSWLLALQCLGQATDQSGALRALAHEDTAVRFFYQPTLADHFHMPLIVRAVPQNDSRISTAPFTPEGRVLFVPVSEMQQLMGRLANSGASWRESQTVERFGPSHHLKVLGELEITVVSSKGTAKGVVEPKRICGFLANLDRAFGSPRPLWEFQDFRFDYSCNVPGFNPQAYPDHYQYK